MRQSSTTKQVDHDPQYEQLRSQLELNREEKQAYFMISTDIQNLIGQAMQDLYTQ
jgi:hypothetical protein